MDKRTGKKPKGFSKKSKSKIDEVTGAAREDIGQAQDRAQELKGKAQKAVGKGQRKMDV
ncbi:MAG TPA: CsbD family protein [Phycisphaerae bacterium]|nr:CsbD family protein [Phycisphaerae bacterium]HOB74169.1 CsbD family protein [Phycisphaerae bacterium]HOJ55907.1 CsbD family protein [Phycisphaerae bacterium]HOL27627.1 CsbD family protein [Phycisphaerae bacterium]HPP22171.1 CsbD family protein [Phycisphaerae bacterium]